MKTITYKQIMSFSSTSYDYKEIGMPEDYEDNVVNFIQGYRGKVKYRDDIILILVRDRFMNKRDRILFYVWCAQQVKHLMKDQRSLDALIVSEKFAFGEVELKILCEAAQAAYSAYLCTSDNDIPAYTAAWVCCPSYEGYFAQYPIPGDDSSKNDKIDKLLEVFQKPNGEWFERNNT